jgi:spore germination cell wall hydrolase CwlJ-like protein
LRAILFAVLCLAALAAPATASPKSSNLFDIIGRSGQIARDARVESLPPATKRETYCLALNLYHEARGTSADGLEAVGHVTLNRVRSPHFPGSVCGVVWQRAQFTWTRYPLTRLIPREDAAWRRCLSLAHRLLTDPPADITRGATHFYAPRAVNPAWAKRARKHGSFGGHAFVSLPR